MLGDETWEYVGIERGLLDDGFCIIFLFDRSTPEANAENPASDEIEGENVEATPTTAFVFVKSYLADTQQDVVLDTWLFEFKIPPIQE